MKISVAHPTVYRYDQPVRLGPHMIRVKPRDDGTLPGFPDLVPSGVMWNVNDGILAAEVRAVFPDGSAEVMPTSVAVRRAQAVGLDLVLVAPIAVPPVAKALDYQQWLHDNDKKHGDDLGRR